MIKLLAGRFCSDLNAAFICHLTGPRRLLLHQRLSDEHGFSDDAGHEVNGPDAALDEHGATCRTLPSELIPFAAAQHPYIDGQGSRIIECSAQQVEVSFRPDPALDLNQAAPVAERIILQIGDCETFVFAGREQRREADRIVAGEPPRVIGDASAAVDLFVRLRPNACPGNERAAGE
jgi:hypothetical protein